MVEKTENLNEKQKKFCEEYLIDFNGAQAAIRAGYSKNSARNIASENLTKPNIQIYLQQLIENRNKETKLTQEQVVADIIEAKNRCMQKAPVMKYDKEEKQYLQVTDENGNDVWQFDAQGALKALDMLMKHTGGYLADNKQQQNITTNNFSGFSSIEEAAKHFKEMIGE